MVYFTQHFFSDSKKKNLDKVHSTCMYMWELYRVSYFKDSTKHKLSFM